MQHKEFIEIISEAYKKAREVEFVTNKTNDILSRGTSKSISSITEDLFACYCAEKVETNKNLRILVDPQLSFKGTNLKNKSGKRPLLIRPDVVISKDNIANCFFDLKTDLGFKRSEFINHAKLYNDKIERIKGIQANYKNGKTKASNKISFSEDLMLCYVILSSKNLRNHKMANLIEQARKLKNIKVFVLTNGSHLNDYGKNSPAKINHEEFNELDGFLESKLN